MVEVYNYFYFDVFPKHNIVLSNVERQYSRKIKKNCIYFGNIIFNLFGWQSWVGICLQTFALVLAIINFNKTSGWQMWVWITSPDILQWGWQGGSSNFCFTPNLIFFVS